MKKIAVIYEGDSVAPHYGMARGAQIYTINNEKVESVETVLKAGKGGCKGLQDQLKEHNVVTAIVGSIGPHAMQEFADVGIEVVGGARGISEEVVEQYLKGTLQQASMACNHHDHGHHHGAHGHAGGSCCCSSK